MPISYVGNTSVIPADTTAQTATNYTVNLPAGLQAPAVVLVSAVLGGSGTATLFAINPSAGWTHLGGAHRFLVWAYAWTSGSPTTFTFTATGADPGYVGFVTVAYNGAVYDAVASVENSQQSPPVSTSTPFDWLVSILATALSTSGAAGAPRCTGAAVQNRVSDLFDMSSEAGFTGWYGLAVADTGSFVGQGQQDGNLVWPALSTVTGWGTVTVALSGALAPSLPTNLTPAYGAIIDFTVDQQFTANYNNTDGSVCQAWQFRQKISGASTYNYWNAGSAAFQSTAIWNAGNCSFTLPARILSNSNTYNWSFNTESSYETTLISGFAADFAVFGQPAPTVTVTAPSGTITTATPTVTWIAQSTGTSTLTAWRVVTYLNSTTTIGGFTPGQSGAILDDSGTVAGTATSYTTGFLPNDVSLVSYVQVTQSGNQTSSWQAITYNTSYSAPNIPVLSTSGPTFDANGAPVIPLSVVCPPNTSTAGSLTAVVYFTDADTPVLTPVRWTATVTAGGGTVIIPDYEATFGVPRTYKARIVSSVDGPSGYSNTVQAVQESSRWVLSDPSNPALFLVLARAGATSSSSSTSISVPTTIEIDRARNQTVFRPFGKSTAVVQYGDVYQSTFTLSFILQGYAQKAMYDALWQSTDTLLVRSTQSDSWYVDAGPTRPLDILRVGDIDPLYVATLTCTVMDMP